MLLNRVDRNRIYIERGLQRKTKPREFHINNRSTEEQLLLPCFTRKNLKGPTSVKVQVFKLTVGLQTEAEEYATSHHCTESRIGHHDLVFKIPGPTATWLRACFPLCTRTPYGVEPSEFSIAKVAV